jgi:hypothetical protein
MKSDARAHSITWHYTRQVRLDGIVLTNDQALALYRHLGRLSAHAEAPAERGTLPAPERAALLEAVLIVRTELNQRGVRSD